jgi:hypothetical protein
MRKEEELHRLTRETLFLEDIPNSHHKMGQQATQRDEADEYAIILKILNNMEDEEARKRMMSWVAH